MPVITEGEGPGGDGRPPTRRGRLLWFLALLLPGPLILLALAWVLRSLIGPG